MPGILPSSASSRKQMRQRLKSRMNPRGRPHLKQRRTVRLENLGFRLALIIIDFFAMKCAPKEESFEVPAPHLSDVGLWNFVRDFVLAISSSFFRKGWITPKNKAPYEARTI